MRKKLALFLVLAMVLSMLPTQVFGNPLQVRGNGRLVQGIVRTAESGNDWDTVIIDLDIEQMVQGQVMSMAGPTVNYYSLLRFTLVSNPDDDQWNYAALRGDGHVTVDSSTHLVLPANPTSPAAAMFDVGPALVTIGQPNRQSGWENAGLPTQIIVPIAFDGGVQIPAGTQGVLRLEIGLIVARGANATLRVDMENPGISGGIRELLLTTNLVVGGSLGVRGNGRLVEGISRTAESGNAWDTVIIDLDIEQMARGQVMLGPAGNFYSILRFTLVSNPDDNQWDYAALRGDGHVTVNQHTHLFLPHIGSHSAAAAMFDVGTAVAERWQPNRQSGWENADSPTQILVPIAFDGGVEIPAGTQGILRLEIGLIVARGATATLRVEMVLQPPLGGIRELLPTVDIAPPRSAEYILVVGAQQGAMPVGAQGNPVANFPVSVMDSGIIPRGDYFMSVSGLPTGVTLRSHPPGLGNPPRIRLNPGGSLQLAGGPLTTAGTWHGLRLTIYRDGLPLATSNPFSLTIGQQGYQHWDYTPAAHTAPPNVFAQSNDDIQIGIRQVNGQATLRMPNYIVNQLINTVEDNNIVIDLTSLEDVSRINMPVVAMQRLAEAGQSIEINFPQGTLKLDAEALNSIVTQSRGANLSFTLLELGAEDLTPAQQSAVDSYKIISRILAFSTAGGNVTGFEGNLSATLNTGGSEPVDVWRLADDGSKELVNSEFNADDGTVTFTTDRLSVFVVMPAVMPAPSAAIMRFAVGSQIFTSHGLSIVGDAIPFIDPAYNRTMVPLRAIAEGLGAVVDWDNDTRTVYITRGADTTRLTIGEPLPNNMGVAVIINNRTLVPIRYVAEVLGARVYWDYVNFAVYIY